MAGRQRLCCLCYIPVFPQRRHHHARRPGEGSDETTAIQFESPRIYIGPDSPASYPLQPTVLQFFNFFLLQFRSFRSSEFTGMVNRRSHRQCTSFPSLRHTHHTRMANAPHPQSLNSIELDQLSKSTLSKESFSSEQLHLELCIFHFQVRLNSSHTKITTRHEKTVKVCAVCYYTYSEG